MVLGEQPDLATGDNLLKIVLLRHAKNMETTVNPNDFTGGTSADIGRQKDCRSTNRRKRGIGS